MTERKAPFEAGAGAAEGTTCLLFPVRSSADITTIAHYYRGEMARMMSWRDRLDRTSNWAIGAVAAMLSVSLASPTAHHGVLLFAMLLVFLLLHIESRRYRFFDIYRTRVRLLERHYYASFFDPECASAAADWAISLAEDLRHPAFAITRRQAMARRLRRNYCWLFLILFSAWLLKATTAVFQPQRGEAEFVHSAAELLHNAAVGYIPGWVVLGGVVLFYGWLLYIMIRHRTLDGELAFGEAHV
jgi:uncharacterized membrane protein